MTAVGWLSQEARTRDGTLSVTRPAAPEHWQARQAPRVVHRSTPHPTPRHATPVFPCPGPRETERKEGLSLEACDPSGGAGGSV